MLRVTERISNEAGGATTPPSGTVTLVGQPIQPILIDPQAKRYLAASTYQPTYIGASIPPIFDPGILETPTSRGAAGRATIYSILSITCTNLPTSS
jgi:hypothetical protein